MVENGGDKAREIIVSRLYDAKAGGLGYSEKWQIKG